MPIIISSNGGKAVKVEKSSIDKEDYLQKYIYENPESIPLYEIKEDIRLLILAREFPTNSGPIDAIGIDKYGEIYIVETKLYANADKRKVIAQSLDYGAALWKHSGDFNEFVRILDEHTQKAFKQRASEKIGEFFAMGTEDVETVMDKVRANLNNGVFHFVVLMDKLDDRLKDLILYVNQNSQFDVYAVEFEYYKHEAHEIIIPKIFGTEVKKDIAVSSSATVRRKWAEETLLQDAAARLSTEGLAAFRKIYEFSKDRNGLYGERGKDGRKLRERPRPILYD
jgi:Asp-tRNA(Asn)/Glu-tRNA(Gln) amidotransferase C subunit